MKSFHVLCCYLLAILICLSSSQIVAGEGGEEGSSGEGGSGIAASANGSGGGGGGNGGSEDDADIQYDQTVYNPNLPPGSFPDFEDFDSAESDSSSSSSLELPYTGHSPAVEEAELTTELPTESPIFATSLSSSSNSSSPSNSSSLSPSSSSSSSPLSSVSSPSSSPSLPSISLPSSPLSSLHYEASESQVQPGETVLPEGLFEKLTLHGDNRLLANLTDKEKSVLIGDAFKRFVQTASFANKDNKNPAEIDRLSALKVYISHLKKEEMEKFKFPTSITNDWIPLISTKAIKPEPEVAVKYSQNIHNHPANHQLNYPSATLEKSGRMLESSSDSPAATALKATPGKEVLITQKEIDDAKKIAQIYQDNTNELLEDKGEIDNTISGNHNSHNLYNKAQQATFKKYLGCCDKLFNQFGNVDEKIYEDLYISPARYRFNPQPEVGSYPMSIKTMTPSLPVSTSYYSYPLRQPPPSLPSLPLNIPPTLSPLPVVSPHLRTYHLRAFPREHHHIQTTAHLNTIPESSSECFADPEHFYHSHRKHPVYMSGRQMPLGGFQQRNGYFRSPARSGWFARKKHAIFGRRTHIG